MRYPQKEVTPRLGKRRVRYPLWQGKGFCYPPEHAVSKRRKSTAADEDNLLQYEKPAPEKKLLLLSQFSGSVILGLVILACVDPWFLLTT